MYYLINLTVYAAPTWVISVTDS